jgi:hypothetical protein
VWLRLHTDRLSGGGTANGLRPHILHPRGESIGPWCDSVEPRLSEPRPRTTASAIGQAAYQRR